MRTALRRIAKLEHQFGTGDRPRLLLVVCEAGLQTHLDIDRYIDILAESGHLPTGSVGVINLAGLLGGQAEEQVEQYLRRNGASLRARTA